MTNILLIGSGGREHALAAKIAESPLLNNLYIAPGNAGTAKCGTNVNVGINDFEAIKNFCIDKDINLLVVGPEEPLVNGIADFIQAQPELSKTGVVGPSAQAAMLEGSKDFSKQFMKKYKIPTAEYRTFTKETYADAVEFLKTLSPPYVLKADGLAAGKGVVISSSVTQAEEELTEMLINCKFGAASRSVVIEEFLSGIELSVFIATDGNSYVLLPHAKDYKKIGENDKGPNTGGMGAVSPVPFVDKSLLDRIIQTIINPTISGLKNENISYKGFIFFGLIIVEGLPFVIEYNARLGDPETEVIIPRIKSDIVPLFNAIVNETLHECYIETDPFFATTVMLVSEGYPGNYTKGKHISLKPSGSENVMVFHAGTSFDANNAVVSNGGRVIAVTSLARTLAEALECSYKEINNIHFDGMCYRKDIGKDMIRLKS